jgi:GcrA cell cycle regulator
MTMYGQTPVDWTVDAIELLKRMWAAGSSHSQIAPLIPHATRSAIAGKIMRLKLPPRDKGHIRGLTRTPAPAKRPKPGKIASVSQVPTITRRNPNSSLAEKLAIAEAETGLSDALKGDAPTGRGVKLIGLEVGLCKWPLGDPRDEDFEFCGCKALPDLPYCAHHSRRSVQKPLSNGAARHA